MPPPAGRGRAFRSNLLPSGAKVFPLQSLTHSPVCRIDGPVNPVPRIATVSFTIGPVSPPTEISCYPVIQPATTRCQPRPRDRHSFIHYRLVSPPTEINAYFLPQPATACSQSRPRGPNRPFARKYKPPTCPHKPPFTHHIATPYRSVSPPTEIKVYFLPQPATTHCQPRLRGPNRPFARKYKPPTCPHKPVFTHHIAAHYRSVSPPTEMKAYSRTPTSHHTLPTSFPVSPQFHALSVGVPTNRNKRLFFYPNQPPHAANFVPQVTTAPSFKNISHPRGIMCLLPP